MASDRSICLWRSWSVRLHWSEFRTTSRDQFDAKWCPFSYGWVRDIWYCKCFSKCPLLYYRASWATRSAVQWCQCRFVQAVSKPFRDSFRSLTWAVKSPGERLCADNFASGLDSLWSDSWFCKGRKFIWKINTISHMDLNIDDCIIFLRLFISFISSLSFPSWALIILLGRCSNPISAF